MDRIREISIKDLISIWVDMSRANNQHTLDGSTKWNSSVDYNVSIENIEFVLSDKLQITLLECKIMLNSKEKVIDAKEKKLFQKSTRKNTIAKWHGYCANTNLPCTPRGLKIRQNGRNRHRNRNKR